MKDLLPIPCVKSLNQQAYDILKESNLTGRLEQGKPHNGKRLPEKFI